ncbi:MAG: NAD(P)H-hydrate dehydratase [Candidatus Thermoplasmatota archaeon]|nr:NAD(P)H-hydrate dehydratase [Candidatus Thermoplasmatota archaeon]
MLTPTEVRVLDRNSEHLGVPTEELMENAGDALAQAILDEGGKGKNILIFCGPGNNGGDGFTAAYYLQNRCNVRVVLLKPPNQIRSVLARRKFEQAEHLAKVLGGADEIVGDISWADMVVDAILGVGIKGDLREPYKTVVHLINSSEKKVISADVPTGLGGKEAIKPDITVTFHDKKEGMTKKNCGEIIVADIGVPKDAVTHTGPGLFEYYNPNPATSHKGDNGHLLIIGGGPYTGAPALAALAAYRVGVDLVTVAAPKWAAGIIAGYSPSIIPFPVECEHFEKKHAKMVLEPASKATAVLIGPGLGRAPETAGFLAEVIKNLEVPVIVDADALNLLAGKPELLKGIPSIVTPHTHEFTAFFGDAVPKKGKKEERVAAGAKETQGVVVLKGQIDLIADSSGRILRNRTGNSAMTVGGTGDVLAGIASGLVAKGLEPFHAASLGAFINGYAGDQAFSTMSYGLMPEDVIRTIPMVLKKFI